VEERSVGEWRKIHRFSTRARNAPKTWRKKQVGPFWEVSESGRKEERQPMGKKRRGKQKKKIGPPIKGKGEDTGGSSRGGRRGGGGKKITLGLMDGKEEDTLTSGERIREGAVVFEGDRARGTKGLPA